MENGKTFSRLADTKAAGADAYESGSLSQVRWCMCYTPLSEARMYAAVLRNVGI